jgi:Domain of unknown function (DUF3859)
MNTLLKSTLFLFLTCLLPVLQSFAEVTSVDLINCGQIVKTPPVAQQEEKKTVHNYVNVMDELETPTFLPGCPNIKAKVGTQFGIQVQVNGGPALEVVDMTTRVTHPLMKNPITGRESTVDEWPSPMNYGYARYAGWVMEEPWELLPGKWKIEILHKDKVMIEKEFNIEIVE